MSGMIGDRLTRQDAVRKGKGEIKDYQDAGKSTLEMLPMFMTGTADAVNDALSISRSTANKFDYVDDDRTEDTLRHILLGGLAEVGDEDTIFGAKNFLGTGIGSKIASKFIDVTEIGGDAENKIDLNNNSFGRALRKTYPNREEFIQKAIDISRTMYAGDTPENIDDLSPMLSYGTTPVPEKAEGGIMMAQQGKMPLPMEEATSAPQGGGPKAANPAAQPAGLGAPTGAPAPAGSSDPRDEAIKEVAQKMQSRSAPAPIPAEVPQMAPPVPPTGLAAPMEEIPMMAKGGMTDDSGMSVMIGLGAPPADYEKAAEGNPPPGATKEEVADDQLVLLSEGELVVPANVVRYHGLGAYEGMRRDALMGLQDMETNGQIEYVSGGAEKADKVDDDGGIIKANQGTFIRPPGTYTQNPVVPQAASSQYVQVPGTQGMNPALNTMTGLGQPLTIAGPPKPVNPYQPVTTASSVYAPNVGSYAGDGTDDAADDSTDDSTDDGTGTDETEEERRRRLAAQNAGDGGGNDNETTPGATTVFGGTSQNGLIRGGKTYEIGYASSSAKPGVGLGNMLQTLTNIDQVRLTDPDTGQSVNMSKAKYDEMKKDRTNAANVNFIDTLMQNQAGIDYNRTRAGAIAPFKTGLAVTGEALGFGKAPGTSIFEQNEYARSLAGSLGIDYNGQSFAEIMASPEANAPRQGAQPPVQNRQFDPMGNPITDGRYDGQVSTPQGLAAPEVAFGAGPNSGVRSPIDTSVYAGPYTTEGNQYPSAPQSTGSFVDKTGETPLSTDLRGAYDSGNITRTDLERIVAGEPSFSRPMLGPDGQPRKNSLGQPLGFTYQQFDSYDKRMAEQQAARDLLDEVSYDDLGLATNDQIRASDRVRQQMRDSGLDREVGRSTSPTLDGISQTGNYGTFEDDFETPDNQGANMDDDAPAASRDMSTNEGRKAAADEEAQGQTGNPNSSAVTDSSGNAVRSGDGSVVTNTPPSSNDSGSDDGCFAKGTLISMADGTTKPVEDVDISDEVKLGGFVFATGKFLINNLYEYKDIQVSGSHMVLEDGAWLRVEDSELSKLITKDDTIVYVFGSENRRIVINDVVFTDYFEVNEQEKLKQIGDSYFTNWKKDAKITSKSNLEVRNTANANATTLAA